MGKWIMPSSFRKTSVELEPDSKFLVKDHPDLKTA